MQPIKQRSGVNQRTATGDDSTHVVNAVLYVMWGVMLRESLSLALEPPPTTVESTPAARTSAAIFQGSVGISDVSITQGSLT